MHKQRVEDAGYDELSGPRLPTVILLGRLHGLEERPRGCWGKAKLPITGNALGALLRTFSVRSRTVRVGSSTSKGYYLRSFEDVFTRYLPPPPVSKRHTVTTSGKPDENEGLASVTDAACDGLETARNTSKSAGCDGVTFQRAGERGCEGNDTAVVDTSDGLIETLL
jgi:hypothetical protein